MPTRRTIVLLLLISMGCQRGGHESTNKVPSDVLPLAIRRAAETTGELQLATLVPRAWSRVYIFEAYAWPDHVTQELGFYWPEGAQSAANVQDRYQLMLFVDDKKVVAWADVDKVEGAFDATGQPIRRSEAVFDVTKDKWGFKILRRGAPTSVKALVHYGPGGLIERVDAGVGGAYPPP